MRSGLSRTLTLLYRPPEVRLLVYEQLVKDNIDCFDKNILSPSKQSSSVSIISSSIRSLMPGPTSLLHALTLVNHQIRDEFSLIFSQKANFRFILDASQSEKAALWKVPEPILSCMRTARLKILANPGGFGDFDPRSISGSWKLRDSVFELMNRMERMEDLRLSIQACGNQLWNPIWLWHYTSQAFKTSEMKAFKRMSFDLEGWNMREPNHLERNEYGHWEWRCAACHFVQSDTDEAQPIRSFCAALYAECKICDPQPEATDGEGAS